jgi:rod shape determining protein RodA
VELSAPLGVGAPVDRRLWRKIPWSLLLVAVAIASLGAWNLASASRSAPAPLWRSQLMWMGVGLLTCFAAMAFDYRYLLRLAYPAYGLVMVLLVAVFARGHAAMGARRWLDLGPAHLQPSELMKIAVVLVLARFFHEDQRLGDGYRLRDLWLPALLVLPPVALVMKQPDLGTSMVIAAIAGSMVVFAKVRWRSLLLIALGGSAAAVGAWGTVLKAYQKKRLTTFLNPEGDMLGAGYHASQSLIAVGSGQGTGKGWGHGTQTQLSFLPEQHTDFIFSVWGEEHGFVGGALLIGLYLLLLLIAIGIAVNAREKFGTFLGMGIGAMIFWHVFVNIGMVTGLLPVVGVTLPLMSYGGSSILTIMIGLGLLMNVGMRKHLY